MKHRTQYTDEDRAEAIKTYEIFKGSAKKAEIARLLQMNPTTFCDWIAQHEGRLYHRKRTKAAIRILQNHIQPVTTKTITTNDIDIALALAKELRATEIIKADTLYQITY